MSIYPKKDEGRRGTSNAGSSVRLEEAAAAAVTMQPDRGQHQRFAIGSRAHPMHQLFQAAALQARLPSDADIDESLPGVTPELRQDVAATLKQMVALAVDRGGHRARIDFTEPATRLAARLDGVEFVESVDPEVEVRAAQQRDDLVSSIRADPSYLGSMRSESSRTAPPPE